MSGATDAAQAPIPEGIATRIAGFLTQVAAIAVTEVWHLRHDPSELLTRAVQPALWLLLFGQVMAHARGLGGEGGRYLRFLAPGILAQSALLTAIFYGIAATWERDLDVLDRYMVSPTPRSALAIGKAMGSTGRGLVQAAMVDLLCLGLGIGINLRPSRMLAVAVFIALGSALFSMFSLIVACLVRTRERFMGIGQVLTMPIFFASNAIYPIELMPTWLRSIALVNPLTYQVDALRSLMLAEDLRPAHLALDMTVLGATAAVLTTIAARLYPRLTE